MLDARMIRCMILYGPRDAVCILMSRGHKVARRWRPRGSLHTGYWVLDGKRVTLTELEDLAETYERLRYRHTERASFAPGHPLRSVSVVTDLHR